MPFMLVVLRWTCVSPSSMVPWHRERDPVVKNLLKEQRAVCSYHMHIHFLIYQTLISIKGLMFWMVELEVCWRQSFTLFLKQVGISKGRKFALRCVAVLHTRRWGLPTDTVDAATAFSWSQHSWWTSVQRNYEPCLRFKWKPLRRAEKSSTGQDFAYNPKAESCLTWLLYCSGAILLNFHACMYERCPVISLYAICT